MKNYLLSSFILALAFGGQSYATTITIGGTSVAGEGQITSVAGATTTTFDGWTALPSSYSSVNTPSTVLVHGNNSNNFKTPTGDNSTYVTTGTGIILDSLARGTNYFGFYWGSLDTYNDFEIVETNGNTIQINGAQLASQFNISANGDSSYFVNFFADPGTTFTTAGFGSTTNSFEFDNVASATPEPSTIALLAGGLLVLGGARRKFGHGSKK